MARNASCYRNPAFYQIKSFSFLLPNFPAWSLFYPVCSFIKLECQNHKLTCFCPEKDLYRKSIGGVFTAVWRSLIFWNLKLCETLLLFKPSLGWPHSSISYLFYFVIDKQNSCWKIFFFSWTTTDFLLCCCQKLRFLTLQVNVGGNAYDLETHAVVQMSKMNQIC